MNRSLWLPLALCLACTSALAQDIPPFKVGVILPLTGALAEYGVAAKNGFELARKEHPDQLKHTQFLIDDSQYDNRQAISSFQKFKNAGDVSLIYVWGYGPAQALAPIAESSKFALLTQSAERSVSAKRAYVVRFGYYGEMAALTLLDYLRSKNLNHLAVVKTELAFFNGIFDGMKKNLRSGESLEVIDSFGFDDFDFKTSLTRVKSKKFDALGVFLLAGQGSQFCRQSKQLGITLSTFGTDMFDSAEVVRQAEGAMNGMVFPAPFVEKAFAARYVKEFGSDVQLAWAANSYEFAMIVAQLFGEHGGKFPAEEVVRSLKTGPVRSAGAAQYEFRDSAEGAGFDFRLVMRRVELDRIVDIAPLRQEKSHNLE